MKRILFGGHFGFFLTFRRQVKIMYTDDTDCLSCSDCKLELIERRWTQLLLNWLNRCVHPKSPSVKELNSWSVVETMNKYKQDICADEIDTDILSCDDIEAFIRYKYPLLRLRYFYETKEVPKKMYLLNSIILYHCCVSSEDGMVDSDICHNLCKSEQETILKFCEKLTDMEVTVHNIELAIKDACNSVKQAPLSSKNPDQDQKPSTIQSDQSTAEYNETYSSPEMTISSLDSMATILSPTERIKQKFNAIKLKSVESESCDPSSGAEVPSSEYNSVVIETSPTGSVKKNAKFKLVESDSGKPSILPEKSPLVTKLEIKTIKDKSPCPSPDRSSKTSKTSDKSPKSSLKNKFDSTFKFKSKYPHNKPSTSPKKSPCDTKAVEKSQKTSLRQKLTLLKFKSSVTVLPSTVTVTTDASCSEIDYVVNYSSKTDLSKDKAEPTPSPGKINVGSFGKVLSVENLGFSAGRRCQPDCACSRCSASGPCCGDPGATMDDCDNVQKEECLFNCANYMAANKTVTTVIVVAAMLIIVGISITIIEFVKAASTPTAKSADEKMDEFKFKLSNQESRIFQMNSYICKEGVCEKVYSPTSEFIHPSLSRCILLCMGPQLWPHPIGYTHYSKQIAVLATSKLEYKFQSVPSEAVHMYLAEAFKLFLGDLAKLERYTLDARSTNISRDLIIKKMYIQMDVETDPDPRIKLETDESYTIKVETLANQVMIKLVSASFCGMRHSLETLSQLILLDQSSGNLITLTNMIIKDAPSYKYRGLMLDTGRNFIPLPDIMRTIDAMASVKLNTFHWRISDVTSFPLQLLAVPQLFDYGSYSRSLVYTKDDVKKIVRRAGIRGIRVLIEVATPGPVGRAWSWMPEATCPSKNKNFTCNNVLCLRLGTKDTVFDILQILYTEILEMTKVDDIFHLSDSVFSLTNCFYLLEDREGFLEKALERLKLANKGFLPKLPIVWYTTHLMKDGEARTWDRYGVQLTEWQPNPSEQFLSRFKVIHSSRWDLSCEVTKQRCKKYRTWQDMYSWKSWRTLDVFSIMGGETILWTDMVDTGNLDYHLWPRAAAVAERLWSDIALNGTVTSPVYVRLDSQRWRMVLKSVQVQPIWPLYCSFSPGVCLQKIKFK